MQEGESPEATAPPVATSDPSDDVAQEAAGDEERQRVAAVLDQLRAGVRQRRAELVTLGASAIADAASLDGGGGAAAGKIAQLKQSEYVREPVPTSHRQGLGRWIVLARKAGYKLFGKWLVRPLLEQQNAYNQAAAALLQELVDREERLARQVRELTLRVEALSSGGAPAGATASSSARADGADAGGDTSMSPGAGNA